MSDVLEARAGECWAKLLEAGLHNLGRKTAQDIILNTLRTTAATEREEERKTILLRVKEAALNCDTRDEAIAYIGEAIRARKP